MAFDVQEIQDRIESVVGQSNTAPTTGGSDWNLRLKYINMAEREWAETYNWQALYKEYDTLASTNSANVSIALPTDFRKIASYPVITGDGVNTHKYAEIRPEEKSRFGSSDRYFYILGNPGDNYTAVVHPGTTSGYLASGASVQFSYYASVASLVSPADVSMIPSPDYLVQRSIAYLWEAREDPRFPQAKSEADKILARMLDLENTHTDAADYSGVRTMEELKYNFRLGRD